MEKKEDYCTPIGGRDKIIVEEKRWRGRRVNVHL